MNDRVWMPLLFPFLAVITIAGFAGGLGVIFMVLESSALGEWGVIVLGSAIVVGVPTAAALVQMKVEEE